MSIEKTNMKTVIFQASMDLIREKGYENVSIMDICKKSGVTRNTFYYYYSSKEDLLGSYVESAITLMKDELFKNLIALPNDWEKLWFLFETHLKLITAEGVAFTRQIIALNLEKTNCILDNYFLTDDWCIPLITNCLKTGLIESDWEPTYINFILTRLCVGITSTWCSTNGDFDLISCIKETFLKLLRPKFV